MRWTTLLDEPTDTRGGAHLVFRRGEAVIASRPTPTALFESWEKHHWDPFAITFEQDHDEWSQLPSWLRGRIEPVIRMFVIGEHTGLDLLSPVLAGAPAETDLRFLATQVADEARHSEFMFRLVRALWPDSRSEAAMLSDAWSGLSPSYTELNMIESSLAQALLRTPASYDAWVQQVSMFHLVTEGMLAYFGQHALTSMLQRSARLPGITQGFLNMGRDEARHVSFGLAALRVALQEGRSDEICGTLARTLPLAVTVDYTSPSVSAADLRDARRSRQHLSRLAVRRMAQLGLSDELVESIDRGVQIEADALLLERGFDPAVLRHAG